MTRPLALIIEDDPNLCTIFETTLRNAGFDTAHDMEGNHYADILSTRRPALVVLDLHLPYSTGQAILADLRNRYADDLLIVIVTADLYGAKDLSNNGETVLVKPVSPARLLDIAFRVKSTLKDSS